MRPNFIAKIFKGRKEPATRLMAITPPRTGERTMLGVENLLSSIAVPEPFSLEIVGDSGGVSLLARCREGSFVRQQLGVHYPQARVNDVSLEEDPLRLKEGEQAWSMDLRLRGPEYLPLRTFRDDDLLDRGSDPLISVIGPLSDLDEGERVMTRLRLLSLGPEWSRGHQEKANSRPPYDPNTSPSTAQVRLDRTNAATMTILALLALPALKAYFCACWEQVPAERAAALRSLRQALHRPGGQERPVRLLHLRHALSGRGWKLRGPLPERPQG